MSARPGRKPSSLTQSSPVTAPAPQPEQAPPAQSVPERVQTSRVKPAPARSSKSASAAKPAKQPASKYPPKVTFYQQPEDTDRVRAVIVHTTAILGPVSMSEFIHLAVMEKVAQYEAEYNNGEPFPSVAALKRGRPLG